VRSIFLDLNEKGRLDAALGGFYALQQCKTDEDARRAFPVYRIDAKSANFVAPEVFNALKGNPPNLNAAIALLSGDLFSLGILISKVIKLVFEK
jgi:hypothetical protein